MSQLVIDAVVHAYNYDPGNLLRPEVHHHVEGAYWYHHATEGDEGLDFEGFQQDWSPELLGETLFGESELDIAVFHGLPLDNHFKDGLVSNEKGARMRSLWPDRVMFYGAVNPFEGAKALELVDYLSEECGAAGIKFYPERYDASTRRTRPLRLDEDYMSAILDKAQERGLVVAVHKAVPAGPGFIDNYRHADVEAAAAYYPNVRFEVVHAGMAFVEEARYLASRYGNVWLNLEVTASLLTFAPRRFAESIGQLASAGLTDRLLFASGCVLSHPQPLIQGLRDFSMPRDLVEDYGYPDLSDEDKAGILGGNFARLHGLDTESVQARLADDEFGRRRQADGLQPRWSAAKAVA